MAKAAEQKECNADNLRAVMTKPLGEGSFENPTINFWLPTGSPLMDLTIRRGKKPSGYPGGKWTELFGFEGAGKTSVALRAARECQKLGGFVVYLNPEHGLNLELAQLIGVNTSEDKFIVAHPYSLESCCDAIENVVKTYFDADVPILIVIDSLSALGVADYTMDEQRFKDTTPSAAGAKKLHEWWRRGVLYYMTGSKIVGLMVRHSTESPRVSFGGDGDRTTHGRSLNYYAWLRLRLKRKDFDEPYGGKRAGSWLTATVKKSKLGPSLGEVSFPFYYNEGFDEGMEAICYLVDQGVLKKTGNGRLPFEGTNYTAKQLRELYSSNNAAREKLQAMMIQAFLEEKG